MRNFTGDELPYQAPTLDLHIRLTFLSRPAVQDGLGMLILQSQTPLLSALIPFEYDKFADQVRLPPELRKDGRWARLIKALAEFHGKVFEDAAVDLAESVLEGLDKLEARAKEQETPEGPTSPPEAGPGEGVGH